MKILVSACLLGACCRYDGQGAVCRPVLELGQKHCLVPVCPEQLGGLPTPRDPAELRGGRVVTRGGADVTEAFLRGARQTLELARTLGCTAAVLKERSPSCGSGQVYDGSFSGKLTAGSGLTAGLLEQNGIPVLGESALDRLGQL